MNITLQKCDGCQALYTTNQAGWVRSYGLFTGTPTVPPGFQPGLPASTKMRKSPSPTSAPPASAKSPSSTWST
jgi:hypothetical protein